MNNENEQFPARLYVPEKKKAWSRAAQSKSMNLGRWITESLDYMARTETRERAERGGRQSRLEWLCKKAGVASHGIGEEEACHAIQEKLGRSIGELLVSWVVDREGEEYV